MKLIWIKCYLFHVLFTELNRHICNNLSSQKNLESLVANFWWAKLFTNRTLPTDQIPSWSIKLFTISTPPTDQIWSGSKLVDQRSVLCQLSWVAGCSQLSSAAPRPSSAFAAAAARSHCCCCCCCCVNKTLAGPPAFPPCWSPIRRHGFAKRKQKTAELCWSCCCNCKGQPRPRPSSSSLLATLAFLWPS